MIDFHKGNILLLLVFQSHMGFCEEVGNVVDAIKIYGVILIFLYLSWKFLYIYIIYTVFYKLVLSMKIFEH